MAIPVLSEILLIKSAFLIINQFIDVNLIIRHESRKFRKKKLTRIKNGFFIGQEVIRSYAITKKPLMNNAVYFHGEFPLGIDDMIR